MLKGIQWFMDRLVERLVPLIATSFSSSVETMHALGQAEQQNQLEEAARRYEAEGKPEIARNLRRRAAQLTSSNPAAEAMEIVNNVTGDSRPSLPLTSRTPDSDVARLPDFGAPATRRRKNRPTQATPIDPPLRPPTPAPDNTEQ